MGRPSKQKAMLTNILPSIPSMLEILKNENAYYVEAYAYNAFRLVNNILILNMYKN